MFLLQKLTVVNIGSGKLTLLGSKSNDLELVFFF